MQKNEILFAILLKKYQVTFTLYTNINKNKYHMYRNDMIDGCSLGLGFLFEYIEHQVLIAASTSTAWWLENTTLVEKMRNLRSLLQLCLEVVLTCLGQSFLERNRWTNRWCLWCFHWQVRSSHICRYHYISGRTGLLTDWFLIRWIPWHGHQTQVWDSLLITRF